MKIYIFLSGLLLSTALSSNAQHHIPLLYKKYFVNCCNDKNTGIGSFLNIGGYFTLTIIHSFEGNRKDTSIRDMIFYENGICVIWNNDYGESTKLFLDEVNRKGKKHYFYNDIPWGKYEIKGDTIIMRSIKRAAFMRPEAEVNEMALKVVGDQSIALIYSKPLDSHIAETILQNSQTRYLPIRFTPYNHLPSSEYSWIKKQKCKPCHEISK